MSLPFIGIFISSANAPLAPRTMKAMSMSRDDMVSFQDFKAPVWARAGEAGSEAAAVPE
jgi:hypothetical protein